MSRTRRPRASSHAFRAFPLGAASRSTGADELDARARFVIGQIAHGTPLSVQVEPESEFIRCLVVRDKRFVGSTAIAGIPVLYNRLSLSGIAKMSNGSSIAIDLDRYLLRIPLPDEASRAKVFGAYAQVFSDWNVVAFLNNLRSALQLLVEADGAKVIVFHEGDTLPNLYCCTESGVSTLPGDSMREPSITRTVLRLDRTEVLDLMDKRISNISPVPQLDLLEKTAFCTDIFYCKLNQATTNSNRLRFHVAAVVGRKQKTFSAPQKAILEVFAVGVQHIIDLVFALEPGIRGLQEYTFKARKYTWGCMILEDILSRRERKIKSRKEEYERARKYSADSGSHSAPTVLPNNAHFMDTVNRDVRDVIQFRQRQGLGNSIAECKLCQRHMEGNPFELKPILETRAAAKQATDEPTLVVLLESDVEKHLIATNRNPFIAALSFAWNMLETAERAECKKKVEGLLALLGDDAKGFGFELASYMDMSWCCSPAQVFAISLQNPTKTIGKMGALFGATYMNLTHLWHLESTTERLTGADEERYRHLSQQAFVLESPQGWIGTITSVKTEYFGSKMDVTRLYEFLPLSQKYLGGKSFDDRNLSIVLTELQRETLRVYIIALAVAWYEALFAPHEKELSGFIKFVCVIADCYKDDVPYHNFVHGFYVARFAAIAIIALRDKKKKKKCCGSDCGSNTKFDLLAEKALFVSALCHDANHQGLANNAVRHLDLPISLFHRPNPKPTDVPLGFGSFVQNFQNLYAKNLMEMHHFQILFWAHGENPFLSDPDSGEILRLEGKEWQGSRTNIHPTLKVFLGLAEKFILATDYSFSTEAMFPPEYLKELKLNPKCRVLAEYEVCMRCADFSIFCQEDLDLTFFMNYFCMAEFQRENIRLRPSFYMPAVVNSEGFQGYRAFTDRRTKPIETLKDQEIFVKKLSFLFKDFDELFVESPHIYIKKASVLFGNVLKQYTDYMAFQGGKGSYKTYIWTKDGKERSGTHYSFFQVANGSLIRI